jgi:hypothetical protein
MVTMRLIPLRRVSFEITYYSSMQRASIGDITEMGITPPDLMACKTCLNQGRYCTAFMKVRQLNEGECFI